MIYTPARIAALAQHVSVENAARLAAAMETMLPQFGVVTPLARAHFMAQACFESDWFTRVEENLNYSAARIAQVWPSLAARAADLAGKPVQLANAAYAKRNGNGNELSGDGWRFRGRGLFQLTGRRNYAAAAAALEAPYVGNPDLVVRMDHAVLTAAWFWRESVPASAVEDDDAEAVTRAINGPARHGLTQRRELTERAKAIFA